MRKVSPPFGEQLMWACCASGAVATKKTFCCASQSRSSGVKDSDNFPIGYIVHERDRSRIVFRALRYGPAASLIKPCWSRGPQVKPTDSVRRGKILSVADELRANASTPGCRNDIQGR